MLDEKSISEEPWMRLMAKKIQAKFDKYWGECNLLISITAVLSVSKRMLLNILGLCVITYMSFIKNMWMLMQQLKLGNSWKIMHKKLVIPLVLFFATSKIKSGKIVLTGKLKYENYVKSVDTIHNVKSKLDTYLEE